MKKCKEGHYYCYQDSKCKPIPKGFRRGVGGYLRREREDEKEDSKKNGNGNGKSNGSSNGNGNGGNGSGNGNGGNGSNGGGNGSGGVGESFETIQNSDGETAAVIVDIIGPAHMRPRLNGNGVWKGTHITEMGNRIRKGGYTILGSGNKKDSSKGPNEQAPVDYRGVGEGLPLAKKDYLGKINSDVLKAYPELDPTKPGDYIKLKRLSAKLRKAHYEPEGDMIEAALNPSQFLGALKKAKIASRQSKMKQAEVDANKIPDNPNLTKSDTQVTQVGDQAPMDPMTAMAPRKISKKVKKLNQKDVADYIPQLQLPDQNQPIPKKLQDEYIPERKMTEKEKRKDDRLKKKYDKSDMKKSMQKQYGKEEGKKVYFATIRKQAMEEEKHKDHEPEMIRNQLKTAANASKRIKKHTLKKDNFKAWVQSKVTKASDYLDTAADYLDGKDMKEELDKKDKPYIKKLVKNLRKGSKTHAKQADKLEKAMNEDALDENLRPLVKGASYLMRKLAKKSGTFSNLAKKGLANTTIKMPKIKKSDLSQYAMYHGTSKKSADKIMKSGFKKSKDSVMNLDRSVIKKKNRAFATTDPEVAKVYADRAAKRTGGKPEILAVKVRDSKLYQPLEGKHRGEYYIKTKEMKPVGRDVKPIKIKNGEVMQNSFNPLEEESNPRIPRKKGQPANSKKHSDLYTDENPKGTIHGLGFKDVATAKASVSKIRNSSRSHAHKIQAAVAMEQRAREMGKTSEAAVYRKFINSMKKKTKAMKESYGPRTKKPNFPKVQIKKKDPQQLIQIHFDTSKPGGGFDVGVDLPVIGNTKVRKTIKDLQRLPSNVQDLLNPETTDSDTNKVTDTVDDAINDYMKNKKGIKQRKRR